MFIMKEAEKWVRCARLIALAGSFLLACTECKSVTHCDSENNGETANDSKSNTSSSNKSASSKDHDLVFKADNGALVVTDRRGNNFKVDSIEKFIVLLVLGGIISGSHP